jgi:hypothetical protein
MALWEPPVETTHMLRTSMTRQHLRKLVSRQQPDKQDFHDSQQSQHVLLRAVFSLGSVSRQSRRWCSSVQSVSHEDASDQECSSRGTFCKSQSNQRMEQVGEDFSGNNPDLLSGFIGLHWTARPIERASATLPAVFQAATPSADFNYKAPGHRNQPPTSNIESTA